MKTAPVLNIQSPPSFSPLTDDSWRRWFTETVWPLIGEGVGQSGPQGTFPQLQIGKARFTNDNAFQDLLNVDQGLYVNYFSAAGNIVYGFACNVHRAAGPELVVGAQINAIGEVGSSGGVFGIATEATAQPFSGTRALIAIEPDPVNQSSTNTAAKWAVNPVYKNRGDGVTQTVEGLGSNLFNYFAEAIVFSSQARSTAGEYCGWSCGIDFLDACLDQSSARAWDAATQYQSGMIVSSGGVLWKAIQSSTNQIPVAGSLYWIQHSTGTTNLAVGIDFSSMSITSMARMASAIRLRNTMRVDWEETGAIGTTMDANNSTLRLCDNSGVLRLAVDVATGIIKTSQAAIAPGAGAAATNATIGGSGPVSAAAKGWVKQEFNGSTYFLQVWQ